MKQSGSTRDLLVQVALWGRAAIRVHNSRRHCSLCSDPCLILKAQDLFFPPLFCCCCCFSHLRSIPIPKIIWEDLKHICYSAAPFTLPSWHRSVTMEPSYPCTSVAKVHFNQSVVDMSIRMCGNNQLLSTQWCASS